MMGLSGAQWIFFLNACLVGVLLLDALQGHLRRRFYRWTQYLPFLIGGAQIVGSFIMIVNAAFAPVYEWTSYACVVGGALGFALHQYFGIARKPGGYSWFRHYLMYGPTALAPLGLSCAGLIGLGVSLYLVLPILLFGSIVQALLLHFRGAFNNVAMYAPMTFPVAAMILLAVHAPSLLVITVVCLIATALVGCIGFGMHLRGFDRQMGGLNIAYFNWLSGPPAFAPFVFTIAGAMGLVAIYLL